MATNEIDVSASCDAVWDVLADGWSYSNWVVGTSHMRAVETGWPSVGSRLYHCVGAWPFVLRDRTVVDVSEPGHRLVMTAHGRMLGAARIALDLTATPDGCHVTMHETPVGGPGRLLRNPVTDAMTRRRNTEALARFAALCERRTRG